jgi:O-antigen ligase/Tfp pilus assembly protein PilF
MLNNVIDKSTFPQRIFRLLLPTLIIWLFAFGWITRAQPGVQVFIRVVFILLALTWLFQRCRQDSTLRFSRIGILLGIYIAYSGILVFRAPLRFHAIEVEVNSILYLLAFLIFLEDTQSEGRRRAWQFAFLQVAIIFSILNLILVARWWYQWLQLSDSPYQLPPFGFRLPGLFLQHPNYEAAFLNLIVPFVILRLLDSTDRKQLLGFITILILFLLTSFFASSRGGMLAMASSSCTIILLYYWNPIKTWRKQLMRGRKIIFSRRRMVLILAGTFFVLLIGYLSYYQARFGGHGGRLEIWSVGWDIFKDAPLSGQGPGSFHVLSSVKAEIPPGFYLVHAHNLILQILAENGLIGLLIVILMFFHVIRLVLRRWPFNKLIRHELIVYIAVLVGMLTHQMVDYAFEAPLYTVGFIFILANISRLDNHTKETSEFKSLYLLLFVTLIALYTIGSIFIFRGAFDHYRGVQAAIEGDWDLAKSNLCTAQDKNRFMSFYNIECGLAAAVTSKLHADEPLLKEANMSYQSGLDRDPFWPLHIASSASVKWELGEQEQAIEMMVEAQKRAPRSSIIAFNLAWMYAENSQPEMSNTYFRLAFDLDPWLWRVVGENWNPYGDALHPQNIQRLEEDLPPGQFHALIGWLYTDAGEINLAKKQFEEALEHDPQRVEAYAGLAKIAQLTGDLSEASQMMNYADFTSRRSAILEEVKGEIAAYKAESESAFEHWIEGIRSYLWPTQSSTYYAVVYGWAYLPMDYPPPIIFPPLPPTLKQGFLQALEDSDGTAQAEAKALSPWFLSQIDMRLALIEPTPRE